MSTLFDRLGHPMGPTRKTISFAAAVAAVFGAIHEYPLWERSPAFTKAIVASPKEPTAFSDALSRWGVFEPLRTAPAPPARPPAPRK